MNMPEPKNENTLWWITSLAISVVCCAILFVVFAGYIFDVKSTINSLIAKTEVQKEQLDRIENEIDNLRRRTTVQQIQILPSGTNTGTQIPAAIAPALPDVQSAPAPKH